MYYPDANNLDIWKSKCQAVVTKHRSLQREVLPNTLEVVTKQTLAPRRLDVG